MSAMGNENWFARFYKSKVGIAIYAAVFVAGMIALVLWFGGFFGATTHSQEHLTTKAELSHLPKFQVAGVSVREFNVTDSRVTGLWEFKFSVQSPYQFEIFYTNIESSLLYKDVNLTSTSDTKPFAQPAGKEMPMHVTFTVDLLVTKGQHAVNDLATAKNSSMVYFNVKIGLDYVVKNGYEGRRNYYGFVNVLCENVKVGFPLSSSGMGRSLDGSRDCKVY